MSYGEIMKAVEHTPSKIAVMFEDAWKYSDHYVVSVILSCGNCNRIRVRSLHLEELHVERMFVCQECGAAKRRYVNPISVYNMGAGWRWLKQQQKKS